MEVLAVSKVVRQALHVCDSRLEIVRVLISLAVTQGLHQSCGCISQVQRHWIGGGLLNVLLNCAVGGVNRIRLGSQSQVGHGLGQSELAFRSAEEIIGIAGRERNAESLRRSEAD